MGVSGWRAGSSLHGHQCSLLDAASHQAARPPFQSYSFLPVGLCTCLPVLGTSLPKSQSSPAEQTPVPLHLPLKAVWGGLCDSLGLGISVVPELVIDDPWLLLGLSRGKYKLI